jgi:succinyl-diaminopimelate desuccinylase
VIDKALQFAREHEHVNRQRLRDYLRIPSISTNPNHAPDVRKAAEWTLDVFKKCGIEAEMVETPGHPAVLADTGPAEKDGPTVLVYGHFDVQPAGDLSLWDDNPFEPIEKDGKLIARGSADDKGQVLTHILAAETWKKACDKLPIRLKFLVEGEEEIGSPNLAKVVRDNKARLACDCVVISDTAKLDWETPAITYGTKGMIYKQITVTGPKNDLHSGAFGGTVTNPGNALCRIIDSLRDEKNRVTIPGFYDRLHPISDDERKMMSSLPFNENAYRETLGSPSLEGEEGFSTLERRWARPTLDVCGIFGGFMGEGQSTIIPAKMTGKVSMRIVPNQDCDEISAAFDKAVLAAAPPGVKVTVETYGCCGAYACPLDLPALKAASAAIESGFGKKPVMIREGGSLPILPMFREILGADSVLMGFSVPDCNLHGPNEFFHLSDFWGGIRTSIHFADEMARL